MGWLCRHCLYERREKPRRRDVLLRFFHHLFAGNAVDLNAFECEVLLAWLTEDTAFAASAPWRKDPLETTLARLRTSAAEGKAATALAVTTARTIIAVLRETPVTSTDSPAERDLLYAIAQHLDEWDRNPQGLDARKFGAGLSYRRQALRSTRHATVLSDRGARSISTRRLHQSSTWKQKTTPTDHSVSDRRSCSTLTNACVETAGERR
ncbi:hypothetical protein OG528_38205 [Streptomyces platensis]|uniref:hypothetical protein n=1 Tax=Streptomyces platensis TaxID=58346 RepID=UPI0030DFCA36